MVSTLSTLWKTESLRGHWSGSSYTELGIKPWTMWFQSLACQPQHQTDSAAELRALDTQRPRGQVRNSIAPLEPNSALVYVRGQRGEQLEQAPTSLTSSQGALVHPLLPSSPTSFEHIPSKGRWHTVPQSFSLLRPGKPQESSQCSKNVSAVMLYYSLVR